jgi:hypothetical protein
MENVIVLMQELSQTLKVVVLVGMGPDIFTYGRCMVDLSNELFNKGRS